MPEPEGLLFLALAAIAFASALSAGVVLVLVGFLKKSKASKVIGGWVLGVSLLPGAFVMSWAYHWTKTP